MHFCRSLDGVRFWPLQHRASHFLWSFCGEFSTILSDFCVHGGSKAKPGTTKMSAFWRTFARQATTCILSHCKTGFHIFLWSFCDDFRCILVPFCMILDSRLYAWSRYMNGPWSTSKRVIFIIFWSIFDPAKSSLRQRFVIFLKNENKTRAQKSDSFWGHSYAEIVFFNIFTRPPKKRDYGRFLVSELLASLVLHLCVSFRAGAMGLRQFRKTWTIQRNGTRHPRSAAFWTSLRKITVNREDEDRKQKPSCPVV